MHGFSLIELMLAFLLIAIGATLALPSFRVMVEKRQITNGGEQIAAFINSAQGLAMETNQLVTVSYSRTAADDWCLGITGGAAACDCTVTDVNASNFCAVEGQPLTISNSHASDLDLVHAMSGDGAYQFDPVRGLLVDLNDSLTVELRSASQDYRLNLEVNNTGRVLLCSGSASHAVPGYAACPPGAEESGDGGTGISLDPGITIIGTGS